MIVSQGAMHSPVLLMRSGIGPANELRAHGIDVVADRRGVGKHLMEHPGVNFGCFLKRAGAAAGRTAAADVRGAALVVRTRRLSARRHVHDPDQQGAVARASAIGSALIMMWVNRSYSTGEVRLTSADPTRSPTSTSTCARTSATWSALVKGVRMMIEAAGASGHAGHVEQVFPISFANYAHKLCDVQPLERGADLESARRRWTHPPPCAARSSAP